MMKQITEKDKIHTISIYIFAASLTLTSPPSKSQSFAAFPCFFFFLPKVFSVYFGVVRRGDLKNE